MATIRRDRMSSAQDLVQALDQLIILLRDEHEEEAISELLEAKRLLMRARPGMPEHAEGVRRIVDAFEGEHELMAYTHQRADATEWTRADELSQASSRVLALARRMGS